MSAPQVVAFNLKRRLSGVSATVLRLVPVQAREIDIAVFGPGMSGLRRVGLAGLLGRTPPVQVWHCRRNNEMLAALLLRRLARRKVRLVFTSAAQRRHTRFTRRLIARMDRVIATSARSGAFLEVPHQVIRHGIELSVFAPGPAADARARQGLPDVPHVAIFGRVRAQKGTDTFVDAMLRIMAAHPTVRALIVGRTTTRHRAFRKELERRIAEAGRTDRFEWRGEVPWDDVPDLYRAADVVTAPARIEGFGLTPLEAMASGRPAVATPVGAFEEQIAEGETGHIVPAGDAGALAAAVGGLLDDPARAAAMGTAGRARVEALFDIRREAAEINAVYRELLARP